MEEAEEEKVEVKVSSFQFTAKMIDGLVLCVSTIEP